jgi:hypothetical protein
MTLWASLTNVPRMLLEVGLSIWAVVALWPRITIFMTTMNRIRKGRRTPLEG